MLNPFSPSVIEKKNALWSLYQELDDWSTIILQLIALSHLEMSHHYLLQLFKNRALFDPDQIPFDKESLVVQVQRLQQTHLLTQGAKFRCEPAIHPAVLRDVMDSDLLPRYLEYLATHQQKIQACNHVERDVMLFILQGDSQRAKALIHKCEQYDLPVISHGLLITNLAMADFSPRFTERFFSNADQAQIALISLQNSLFEGFPLADAVWAFIHDLLERLDPEKYEDLFSWVAAACLLRGEWERAKTILAVPTLQARLESLGIPSLLLLRQGNPEAAGAAFLQSLILYRKQTGSRAIPPLALATVAGILAALRLDAPKERSKLQKFIDQAKKHDHGWAYQVYVSLVHFQQFLEGKTDQAERVKSLYDNLQVTANSNVFLVLFHALLYHWSGHAFKEAHIAVLAQLADLAGERKLFWVAAEFAALIKALPNAQKKHVKSIQAWLWEDHHPLVDLHGVKPAWEIALNALSHFDRPPASSDTTTDSRLIWLLTHYPNQHSVTFAPREQKRTAKGTWTKGRAVALKRLHNHDFDGLLPQDEKLCAQIEVSRMGYGYYGQPAFEFSDQAALALVGHPLLFWEEAPEIRVEVVRGEPELLVQKKPGKELLIQLQPTPPAHSGQMILVSKETPTRLKVIELRAEHQRILGIIGNDGLTVPASAKDRVLAAIGKISSLLTIHSDIGGGVAAEEVPADPLPRMQLLPFGEGLKAALLVRPFAESGPYFPPGEGGKTVMAEVDGKRLQTHRDLALEKNQAEAVLTACPVLETVAREEGEWQLEEPEPCLELLSQLQSLGEDQALVEWPEGQRFQLAGKVDSGNLHLQIQQKRDWFGIGGEVRLDEDRVLDMRRLIDLLDHRVGRFVQLADGEFLALSDAFRKRLEELRSLSSGGKGDELHVSPLAALTLDGWEDVGNVTADEHWRAHIQKMRDARAFTPEIPSTFQAELRDYQEEGFRWLGRLAHWGVGACLADDMGLGKTVQAMAAVLMKAPNGPSLVVAPTSVCMNWQVEAERFAPTLKPIYLSQGDRQKTMDNLQAFDLLICSYGLLQQQPVADMLAQIHFQTIILDEAQAIKNIATKRAQGAMNLQGDFKLITTGTPVENHLGELWNLFRFINPGLLGSLEHFTQTYATPMERGTDKEAKRRLKRLIQPFILRRTKTQVLQELPPRTEILLHVELSEPETAFYEALRRASLEKLAQTDLPQGQKQLQILAEIMKLRRACCNVKLVEKTLDLPSAKLQAFGEIVQELLENHHKALVFSQFVDHLSLLRNYLDNHDITYQYLDGSTPAKERKKRVEAFQGGEGDIFLISLKAGGTGLNLTAADYVIHMDPWWNPAVEDQASDRAHRMGQQRPVTIYRLVAKNTIEEKIVDLHLHKRDLADSLLEGADVSGKIDAQALLNLMNDQEPALDSATS